MSRRRTYYRDWQHPSPQMPAGFSTISLALSLARTYPDSLPSVERLMDRYGMSRATAYRWIAAMKAAQTAEALP